MAQFLLGDPYQGLQLQTGPDKHFLYLSRQASFPKMFQYSLLAFLNLAHICVNDPFISLF